MTRATELDEHILDAASALSGLADNIQSYDGDEFLWLCKDGDHVELANEFIELLHTIEQFAHLQTNNMFAVHDQLTNDNHLMG